MEWEIDASGEVSIADETHPIESADSIGAGGFGCDGRAIAYPFAFLLRTPRR